ncbi:MAG: hypothetical protein MJH10_10150 [Epibacterium sp.]|nr:hypothetical protein [Epibacterium sp.]NQX73899.1 hypothetical protein [Epibacterium sp.]
MIHALIKQSSPEQIAAAKEAADWLVDAVATYTQDRRFLRGEPEEDEIATSAIRGCGIVAALRAMHNLRPKDDK